MHPYIALSWLSGVGISGELSVGIDCQLVLVLIVLTNKIKIWINYSQAHWFKYIASYN